MEKVDVGVVDVRVAEVLAVVILAFSVNKCVSEEKKRKKSLPGSWFFMNMSHKSGTEHHFVLILSFGRSDCTCLEIEREPGIKHTAFIKLQSQQSQKLSTPLSIPPFTL